MSNLTEMKKLITAIFIWLSVQTAYAAESSQNSGPVKDTVNREFKKVVVKGNTTVYFIQSNREEVSIDEGDPKDISIIQTGNKLRINSTSTDPVLITVYFKDIYRIEASDHAVVRSQSALNLQHLQIMLRDNSSGNISLNTNSLYTETDDQSKLVLRGKTGRHIIKGYSNLKTKKLRALYTEDKNDTGLIAQWERD
jgi:hypothetical protein